MTTAASADGPRVAADAGARPTREQAIVALEKVSKSFGGVPALTDASLTIASGEVHAVCGANGAGKSTMVKIIAGAESPDAGTLFVDGAPVTGHSPARASHLGLQFIHQELNLVPKFTAAQNMALGYSAGSRAGFLDRRRIRRRAQEVMDRLGTAVPLDVQVDRLSVSERWLVCLGRSLMNEARLIVMDEPTASFSEDEVAHLHAVIRDVTEHGVAVLYISHRLDEVLRISSTVTVLRDGKVVARRPTSELDQDSLTREIIGHAVPDAIEASPPGDADHASVLELDRLAHPPRVRDVNLAVRRGEILGLAGLVGAGRTELARLIAGIDRPTAGAMTLNGRPYRPRSAAAAIAAGVAMLPEERRSQGLLLRESVALNVSLATLRQNRNRWTRLVSPAKANDAARTAMRQLGIKADSPAQPVGTLSGGNQQKVLLAKYLRTTPKVLILDEPTVGVDVGARADLYEIIRELAKAGTAVIVISSDFAELAICHRVAVLREGRLTQVIDGAQATKARLTSLCYEPPPNHGGGAVS